MLGESIILVVITILFRNYYISITSKDVVNFYFYFPLFLNSFGLSKIKELNYLKILLELIVKKLST